MENFRSGNVIKLKTGAVVIVSNYRTVKTINSEYEVLDWISFETDNVSGTTKIKTTTEEYVTYVDEDGEECNFCGGMCGDNCGMTRKRVTNEIPGIDQATYLASSCKEYIINTLTKGFDF